MTKRIPYATWFSLAFATVIGFAEPADTDPKIKEVFHADKLQEIEAAVSLAISDGKCPGGVVWIERNGIAYHRAFGSRALAPEREAMTEDTIFDLASLTKVIATTTAIMQLVERGKIDPEETVSHYIPEFHGAGKEAITVRQLLTHTSGLRPGISGTPEWHGIEGAINKACSEPLPNAPGSILRYSDINFILLGEVVRRVSGRSLNEYCATEIFRPLKMGDTTYLPPPELAPRMAPTTKADGAYLRGIVHDPTSRRMGGVAGHAGLFSTAADLARFARMLLGEGTLDGVSILKPETFALMTAVQTPPSIAARRGFGWDIDSPYSGPRGAWFPLGSFGHTGWTGTSLWIDPFSQTFVIFLSNRNHPTESGNVIPLRRTLGTLAAESVRGFNFTHVPNALSWQPGGAFDLAPSHPSEQETSPVLTGIDILVRDRFAPLKGLTVGLVTNQTGIDRERHSTIDLLQKAPEVRLAALFSPEHGIRGVRDEKIGDSRDEKSGLPIYSLYGDNRAPTPKQLAGLDALVFDIADIGCRFYTYVSTLGECMIAARNAGKKVFVLDRPNPITGARVEGPMPTGERTFVAWHTIPIRHGMTVGELARMFAAERAEGVDLTVIPCAGWTRGLWFDATALPWTNPSPNMRDLNAATLYPGVALLEFCQVSVGRGTDRPFELFGAPYIDDAELAAAINAAGLDGIRVIPTRFTPSGSVFAGKECRGVQFVITGRETFSPLDLGITLATAMQRLYAKDVNIEQMAKLLCHPATLEAIKAGRSRDEIKALWAADREAFQERREKYLLYR